MVEGLQLEISDSARWLRAEDNQNLVIRDNMFSGGSSQAPLEFIDVDGVRFSNNIVDNLPATTGETFAPEGDNLVIEGNFIGRGWHGINGMFGDDDTIVIRGNVYSGMTSRVATCNRQSRVLFEDNVQTQGIASPGSGGAAGKFNCEDSIFRNNKLYKTWGTATTLTPRIEEMSIRNTRLYNNVWDDNWGVCTALGL